MKFNTLQVKMKANLSKECTRIVRYRETAALKLSASKHHDEAKYSKSCYYSPGKK